MFDKLAFNIARISRGKNGDIMRVGVGVLVISIEFSLFACSFLAGNRTMAVLFTIAALCWVCLASALMYKIIKAINDIETKFNELDSYNWWEE